MRALILAAGEGRRLRPLTLTTPKPLVEVGGMPMAVRQLLALKEVGICDIVMNVAYHSRQIMTALGDGSRWGVRLHYSVEGECAEEALETLGGIAKALPLLTADGDDAFIAVASDIVTDFDLGRLVERGMRLRQERRDAHLVLVPNPAYHESGDMSLDETGCVRPLPKTRTFASLGVYRASLFAGVPAERAKLFPWMWRACEEGRVSGECFDGRWLNVGDMTELRLAREQFGNKMEQ